MTSGARLARCQAGSSADLEEHAFCLPCEVGHGSTQCCLWIEHHALGVVMLETEGAPLTHGDPSVIRQNRADATSPKGEDEFKNTVLDAYSRGSKFAC